MTYYETEQTVYLFALNKDGTHQHLLIPRPEKIITIINNKTQQFQLTIESKEDLSKLYPNPERVDSITLTLSNDPDQDPYGQMTNLGYYSIKIQALHGKLLEASSNSFTFICKIKPINESRTNVLLKTNFPNRVPIKNKVLGPLRDVFQNEFNYTLTSLSFDDSNPDIVKSITLGFENNKGKKTEAIHDMTHCWHGAKIISEKEFEDINKEMSEILS